MLAGTPANSTLQLYYSGPSLIRPPYLPTNCGHITEVGSGEREKYSGPCDLRPLYLTIPFILRLDMSDITCIFSV